VNRRVRLSAFGRRPWPGANGHGLLEGISALLFPETTDMTTSPRQFNWTNLCLLGALVAVIGYQSQANRAAPPASPAPPPASPSAAAPPKGPTQPAVIATFDLERTFNSLSEKHAADQALQKQADEMQVKGDEQSKAIKQMQADLEVLQPGTAKHRELSDKIAQATMDFRAYVEYCKAKLDSDRAKTMKRIYLNIRKAAGEIAEQNHYAIVFVDDSIANIPQANEEETNRQISARRMVYTSAEIDVTDQIIHYMNGAFQGDKAQAQGGP
jgi:Skp family chaperone for outer membrane proteins